MTGAAVRRVLIEERRATGVEWTDGRGTTQRAAARAEVILSAGAFGSPQLLELSGIGDGERLRALGIEAVHHNPEVGENLQDHMQVRIVYKSTKPITVNDDMRSPFRKMGMGLRYALLRKGPLTVSAGYAGGFFRSDIAGDARPDIQCLFINFSTTKMGDRLHPFSGFTVSACPLRPESRGYVHAVSPDPAAPPDILANFLSTEHDRREIVAGLRIIRKVMGQEAIRPFVAEEHIPGDATATDAQLLEYARETGGSIYHASCSAAMGKVVDGALRVRGVDGLRVADASVMPAVVSGNTNAVVIAIGEKAADLIRSERKD